MVEVVFRCLCLLGGRQFVASLLKQRLLRMNVGCLDKRGVAADWDVSGRKKGGSACPEVFQAWEYGRPWPPELPLVFLT